MRLERLAVIASGRGTDFQSILDHIKMNVLQDVKLTLLICNTSDAYVMTRSRNAGIKTEYIEGIVGKKFPEKEDRRKAREEFDIKVIKELKRQDITLISLAGFNQIVSPVLIDLFSKKVMNIHPAYDTIQYGGVGMYGERVHRAVLANNEQYSGCTVHYVDNTVDLGPVILRQRVAVKSGDTIDSLSDRILVWEHRSYSKAIQIHVDNELERRNSLATEDFEDDEWEKKWNERQKNYIEYQREHSLDIYGKSFNEII